METETLTEDERHYLRTLGARWTRKALRIIDAQAARVAELDQEKRLNDTDLANWREAIARADAAERKYQGACDELRIAREAGQAAESESAALRAEVDEWRAMYTATLARADAADLALTQECRLALSESDRARAAESESTLMRAERDEWRAMYTATLARADAAEMDLAQHADSMYAAICAANARADAAEKRAAFEDRRSTSLDAAYFALKERAESESAVLRAGGIQQSREIHELRTYIERLKAESAALRAEVAREIREKLDAESRLAAANALLARCYQVLDDNECVDDPYPDLAAWRKAHLAARGAAPATAPTCEHGQTGYCGACCLLDEPVPAQTYNERVQAAAEIVFSRTEAEQRVLDAVRAIVASDGVSSCAGLIRAHLAAPGAAPATAPVHDCDSPDCGACTGAYFARKAPTSTAAEQRVLDACAAMQLDDNNRDTDEDPLEPSEHGEDCYIYTDDQYKIAKAELARRGAK